MPNEQIPVTQDHDLLIKLNENVSSLRDEVRQITNQFNERYADQEARLRVLEATSDRLDGTSKAFRWMLAAIAAVATILEPLTLWFLSGIPHK